MAQQGAVMQRSQGSSLAPRGEHPLQRKGRDFDTLFDRLWRGWLSPLDPELANMRVWDFDVTENDKEIMVRAEMPGFEENELDVQLNNDVLTIKAEKEQKEDGRQEYRSFYRTVALPSGVQADKIQATYRNGVLEVHIPRAEGARPRRIQVQGQQGESRQTGQGQQKETGQTGSASSAGESKK